MSMLAHHRLRSRLGACVDGELDRHAAEQIDAHLRSCWSCSGEAQTIRLLKAVLARGAARPGLRGRTAGRR